MEKEATTPRPVCAQEALALLNCAAESPYDREKCLSLLDTLRGCIAQKRYIYPTLNNGRNHPPLNLEFLAHFWLDYCRNFASPKHRVKKFSLAEASSAGSTEGPKSK